MLSAGPQRSAWDIVSLFGSTGLQDPAHPTMVDRGQARHILLTPQSSSDAPALNTQSINVLSGVVENRTRVCSCTNETYTNQAFQPLVEQSQDLHLASSSSLTLRPSAPIQPTAVMCLLFPMFYLIRPSTDPCSASHIYNIYTPYSTVLARGNFTHL